MRQARDSNEAYCPDTDAAGRMIEAIKQAKQDKDTLGGVVEVQVVGLPPGIGRRVRMTHDAVPSSSPGHWLMP